MPERITAFPSAADRWIAYGVLAVALAVFGPILYSMFTDSGAPTPLAERVVLALIGVLAVIITASVLCSQTELRSDEITFRQGLYFRAAVPYENIRGAKAVPAPAGIWMPGVRRESGGQGIRIVLSSKNLVELQLTKPQRAVVFGFIPIANAQRILFNAPSPEQVAQTLMERSHPPRP